MLMIACAAFGEQGKSHFDSGMELFNKNEYSKALDEFKASYKEDPASIESHFYYALALYYCDRFKEARSEFKEIYDKGKGDQWGMASKSYMDSIDMGYFAPYPERDFEGLMTLSFENDDNTTYGPSVAAGKADIRSMALLSLTYKPLIYSFRPLLLSYNLFGSIYDKNTAFNMYGGGPNISLSLPLPFESIISMLYGSDGYNLKGDPYYVSDYTEANYAINFPAGSPSWTSFYLDGANNKYKIASYEVYDGRESKFGVRHDMNAMTYMQYEYRASITRGDDFSCRSHEYSMGETIFFPYFHKLSMVLRYMLKGFLFDDSLARERRNDTSFGMDFSVTKDMSRYLNLEIKYAYTNYVSNLESSNSALGYGSYIDHVLSLLISYKF